MVVGVVGVAEAAGAVIWVAGGAVIRITGGAVIGTTGGIAVGIASGISGVAGSGERQGLYVDWSIYSRIVGSVLVVLG